MAGVHEGKNEINARLGYFKLGINLNTEKPTAVQIRSGVEQVLTNPLYKNNVKKLSEEFKTYHPQELCEQYIYEVLQDTNSLNAMKSRKPIAEELV